MAKVVRKVNYAKWGVIISVLIGVPGAIATLVTFPELGCKIGLNTPACVIPQKEVEFVVQAETGEPLSNVTAEAIAAKGAPETQYTDDHGYVKINIPIKGDVRITLSKKGYPTQDFMINLANEQDTIRLIRLSPLGQPNIQPIESLPPHPSPIPSASFSAKNPIQDKDVTWELEKCVRKGLNNIIISCSFSVTTTNDSKAYSFSLGALTKIIDNRGHEYFADSGFFADNRAGGDSYIGHELVKGAIYRVTINFIKIPSSVSEIDLLIVGGINGLVDRSIKFHNIPIE